MYWPAGILLGHLLLQLTFALVSVATPLSPSCCYAVDPLHFSLSHPPTSVPALQAGMSPSHRCPASPLLPAIAQKLSLFCLSFHPIQVQVHPRKPGLLCPVPEPDHISVQPWGLLWVFPAVGFTKCLTGQGI